MKKIFLLVIAIFLATSNAFSTTLPAKLTSFIRDNFPYSTIRFDGLIMCQDSTTYLPLIPAIEAPVENLEVVYTYPAKAAMKKKPEIVVFNNNYVLLKVIKDKNGVTISKATDYPITVKTGVLPQDLLVPKGLYIPESLQGILGDLKIPVGTQNNTVIKKAEEKPYDEVSEFLDKKNPVTIPKVEALRNKLFFISNYDSTYLRVINSDNTQPLFSIKLESIPRAVVPVSNKYLLITTGGKTYVDIVDVAREEIAKQLDLTVELSEIAVDEKNMLAYIAAKNEDTMFVIDLKTMELKHKVLLKGCPINLALTDDGSKLVYQDKNSAKLYAVKVKEEFATIPLVIIPNISKIIATNNVVYVLSRTQNQMTVIAYPSKNQDYATDVRGTSVVVTTLLDSPNHNIPSPIENLILSRKDVAEKPVDMLMYKDKIYILCAKSNQLNVYDIKTNNIVKTFDLPVNGFSKKLTRVDNTNFAVISNARDEKYLIFDLNSNSTIQQVPLNTKINDLVILNKNLPVASK